MEDRFKCRFWHNTTKRMYDNVHGLYQTFVNVGDNVLFEYAKGHLMQCTGVKDIKGHLIYEGDIVYLAGQGDIEIEYPFLDLFESRLEGDVGNIIGNIYE